MRQVLDVPRVFDTERIAVNILSNMETAFRNAANQIAAGTIELYSTADSTIQTPQERTETPQRPLVMNTEEACKALGISKPKLYELARSGKLRCIRVGKAIRYSEQAIIEYIHAAEQESQTW